MHQTHVQRCFSAVAMKINCDGKNRMQSCHTIPCWHHWHHQSGFRRSACHGTQPTNRYACTAYTHHPHHKVHLPACLHTSLPAGPRWKVLPSNHAAPNAARLALLLLSCKWCCCTPPHAPALLMCQKHTYLLPPLVTVLHASVQQ